MELVSFKNDDYKQLYDFMRPLWLETYSDCIPNHQILYLLDHYFNINSIDEFLKKGYKYYHIYDNVNIGVVVYYEYEDGIYLDKLYILPEFRGKGYPKAIFNLLLNIKNRITLNVNQKNKRAVACYFKEGFKIKEEQIIDLGEGMVNIDYLLELVK